MAADRIMGFQIANHPAAAVDEQDHRMWARGLWPVDADAYPSRIQILGPNLRRRDQGPVRGNHPGHRSPGRNRWQGFQPGIAAPLLQHRCANRIERHAANLSRSAIIASAALAASPPLSFSLRRARAQA